MTTSFSGKRALGAAMAALCCVQASCSVFRPEGDGGWSRSRRRDELAKSATLVDRRPALLPQSATEATSLTEAPPTPRILDLPSALALADRHNRSIAAAEQAVAAARGDVAIARSPLLPVATLRGGYNWYSDEQTNTIDASFLPPGTAAPTIVVREQDFATVNAALRLAIDLSGEYRHGLEAAQAGYRAEEARAWATRLQEERDVTAAYFGLLEARALAEVMRQTIALHERQRSDAESRYQQGRLTRNEVLVVDVALANSKQNLERLRNSIAAQRRALNRATGLDVAAATEVRDVAARPSLPPLDEVVAAAREGNPLVTSMLEEVQAADERLTSAERGRFPRVGAGAAYDATTSDVLQPNDSASVGVTVDVDLYSFRREGEIAKLDAAARRSRLLLDRSAREVESLVRDSYDRVRERLTAIDTATVATRQADENLRIRQVQFDEGRATSEDLLDAAELAARQRASLATALYQAHLQRAELQQLVGEPLASVAEGSTADTPDLVDARSAPMPVPAPSPSGAMLPPSGSIPAALPDPPAPPMTPPAAPASEGDAPR